MTRETLDETLDRVAGELTAVRPDPTFVMRLRPRLDAPNRHVFPLKTFAAAACVVAVAVAAALFRNVDSDTRHVTSAARPPIDGPAAPALPGGTAASETFAPRVRAVTATKRPVPAFAGLDSELVRPSTIPALSSPPSLDVAHLELDPLVVHPVDVSSLEIDGLSVTGLAAEEPKE